MSKVSKSIEVSQNISLIFILMFSIFAKFKSRQRDRFLLNWYLVYQKSIKNDLQLKGKNNEIKF